MGTLHDSMGQIDAALSNYELALGIARRLGNRHWEGGVLGNLGNVYYSEGRIDEARSAYEAGLVIAIELGNRQWEANTLCNLGLLSTYKANRRRATNAQRSLQVAREIGHAPSRGLRSLQSRNGRSQPCRRSRRRTRSTSRERSRVSESLGDYLFHGQTLGYLGLLCSRQGDLRKARRHLQRGQALLEATDDKPSLAILHCNAA